MSSIQEIDVQDIDHLGIIAGIIDEIGIVEIIDQLLGTHDQENDSWLGNSVTLSKCQAFRGYAIKRYFLA